MYSPLGAQRSYKGFLLIYKGSGGKVHYVVLLCELDIPHLTTWLRKVRVGFQPPHIPLPGLSWSMNSTWISLQHRSNIYSPIIHHASRA